MKCCRRATHQIKAQRKNLEEQQNLRETLKTEKQKNFEWMHHYCQNWQNRNYQSPVSIANLMKYDHKEFTYVYAWKIAEICN